MHRFYWIPFYSHSSLLVISHTAQCYSVLANWYLPPDNGILCQDYSAHHHCNEKFDFIHFFQKTKSQCQILTGLLSCDQLKEMQKVKMLITTMHRKAGRNLNGLGINVNGLCESLSFFGKAFHGPSFNNQAVHSIFDLRQILQLFYCSGK